MAYQVKLEDSNMANYGSDEHKQMRKDAAGKEKAWENAGKEPGLQIWRIEKFKIKHWPKDRYGEFFSGDSYIILNTMVDDEGKKTYDVFFWLGNETTQDEAGTAAYKTVELDDILGDEPVQSREVQGNESKKFLDCFNKMTILSGGVESGFRNVKPEDYKPRLLHVTGYQKHVQVYQVPLKVESLNDHDAFVLDAGLKVFQFNGSKSSAWEKRKANAIVDELQASRHGKVQKSYIIDGLGDKGNPLIEEFWGYFGGRPNAIADVEEQKEVPQVELTLQHLTDASGVMEVKEVGRGKLDKSKLNSDDAFILDAGGSVFVWLGKGSSKNEKREAMAHAVRYLSNQGRAADIPILRVMEGAEPPEFWQAFGGQAVGGRAQQMKQWQK
jgi:gelsolin